MGKLYLCGTPIGNLEDMTLRAIRILREVDLIAAEDTRQTIKLLNHYGIKKPMISYHEHNRYERGIEIVKKIKSGQNVAVVTDAGMPGISDPGEDIAKLCIDEGIDIEVIPGPTASITALVLSGLPTSKFVFEGFLSREGKERKKQMEYLNYETKTVIIYESPYRVKGTLLDLYENLGNRKIAICRELTKKFEEIIRTDLENSINLYEDNEPKGEFVIILEGKDEAEIEEEKIKEWDKLSVNDHIDMYLEKGLTKKEAMKMVAKDRGISKRDVYKYTI
jgi:16S rRNA (cytidine1402-2'-O)-methyltransferase